MLIGAALASAGLAGGAVLLRDPNPASAQPVLPTSGAVASAETLRRTHSGRTTAVSVTAAPGTVDLGGRTVEALLYNGVLPGQELRVSRGDVLKVDLKNGLGAVRRRLASG